MGHSYHNYGTIFYVYVDRMNVSSIVYLFVYADVPIVLTVFVLFTVFIGQR